jgi:SAM-dependent methyltransferase
MRWWRGSTTSPAGPAAKSEAAPRVTRRCIGLSEFLRDLRGNDEQRPCVLDLGPTSPANITFLAERNIHVYNQDLLRSAKDPDVLIRDENGVERVHPARFFAETLAYPEAHFDSILCWDVADYLPEELVKPVMEKLYAVLKPHGSLLAFFHTKDAGPEAPYCRYHIVQPDTLELEPAPGERLQRIFNNRHIENLFKDFSSRKFFLGRDNLREVIVVR